MYIYGKHLPQGPVKPGVIGASQWKRWAERNEDLLRENGKGGFVFLAHPRTASRAVSQALHKGGTLMLGGHHDMDVEVCEMFLEYGGMVSCVKRNMFDVLVSWYARAMPSAYNSEAEGLTETAVSQKDFGRWLNKIMCRGHQYLDPELYHFGVPYSNYTIPFEVIGSVIPILQDELGMEVTELEHVGKSNRSQDYREYYSPGNQKLVEDRWGKDLELTGYQFED